MEISFKGKRALVTGAGKGIGRGIVKALVQCGAQVVALSRTQADLDSLKQEFPSVEIVCVDLADLKSTQAAVQELGDIDLLVNNAGIAVAQPFLEVTSDVYEKIMAVNLRAPLFISQIVAKRMVSRGNGGSIVNVSSNFSQAAHVDFTAYCMSKAGLDMMTKMMALELGPHKIRVNSVLPVRCLTPMVQRIDSDPIMIASLLARVPLGRFVEVEEIVNVILFLLSDQASMISGATLPVDGGYLVA